ncbi:uncharacterized protein LOC134215347 [Armigeres subalbatus]|uniref:uncharacterized protein LOC134215347 n=1 Tax=Armigeres subalbatus TaxID=124917 RepID=UPI002ED1F32F
MSVAQKNTINSYFQRINEKRKKQSSITADSIRSDSAGDQGKITGECKSNGTETSNRNASDLQASGDQQTGNANETSLDLKANDGKTKLAKSSGKNTSECERNGTETSNRNASDIQASGDQQTGNANETSLDLKANDGKTKLAKSSVVKRYEQKYKSSWESKLPWLEQRGDLAFCKICEVSLKFKHGGLKDLRTHQIQDSHKKNASYINVKKYETLVKLLPAEKKVIDACIRICLHAVDKNISFQALEGLIPTIKSAFPDSKIASSMKLHRTKATRIVVGVTGQTQKVRLVDILKQQFFSIIVDESTDYSSEKVLCITVRYFDEHAGRVRDAFYDLVPLSACDATSLYKAVEHTFVENNIPYKNNLIGIGSDNAAVMVGSKHSLTTLLRRDCPHLVGVRCICHSLALCASNATKQLPDYLEQMLKDIYSYLSASPARLQQFDKIQSMLEYNPIRVPRMHDVRFLSRGQVVKAVVARYEPLKIYFGFATTVDHLSNAVKIHNSLTDPVTEIFLLFLDFILPCVDGINKLFQSEQPEVLSLHSTLTRKIKQLLSYFVKSEVVKSYKISDIRFHPREIKPPGEVYLGVKVAAVLDSPSHNIDSERLLDVQNRCTRFYKELVQQMLNRFQLENDMFKSVSILTPSAIISGKGVSLSTVLKHFPTVILTNEWQNIDNEFNEIKCLDFKALGLSEHTNDEEFWLKIFDIQTNDGKIKFPLMAKLMKAILSLPHSSAAAERIFSAQNLNKTKLRNKLRNKSMVGILRTKDWLKVHGSPESVEIPPDMREKYNSKMYDTEECEAEEDFRDVLELLNE